MDGYQRGVTAADVEPVFAAYEAFLRDALPRAEAIQAAQPAPCAPQGPFPVPAQRALCRRLSERVGLDFAHARLDESLHPFCGGTPTRRAHHHLLQRGRTSPSRCSACCTRPATRCTSAACPQPGRASPSARPPAWRRMNRSP